MSAILVSRPCTVGSYGETTGISATNLVLLARARPLPSTLRSSQHPPARTPHFHLHTSLLSWLVGGSVE